MPKQIHTINEFHGGINDNADPRDILNNELVSAENVAVHELGKIRMLGGIEAAHDANPADADTSSGYGLFTFSHDMAGAEGGTISEAATDYIAIADTDSSGTKIDISKAGATFGVDRITLGTDTGGYSDFYYVDGALRVNDADFTNVNNGIRWYGYIGNINSEDGAAEDKVMMEAASTPVSITDAFVDTSAKILQPAASTFEGDEAQISGGGTKTYANQLNTTSPGTSTLAVALSALTGANEDSAGAVASVQKITINVTVASDTEDGMKGFWKYTLKVGRHDGSAYASPNQDVVIEGTGADTNEHIFAFDADDTATNTGNPWLVTFTVNSMGGDISGLKLSNIQFQEGSTAYTDHSGGLANDAHNFHIAFDQVSSSDVSGAFGWDEEWEAGISLIYDGNQESLITQLVDKSNPGSSTFTFSEGARPPQTSIFCQYSTSWNKRITGAVVYLKRTLDKQWYPQYELDLVKGMGKALFSDIERPVTYWAVGSAPVYIFSFEDDDSLEPQFAITYESRTGISHTEKSISSKWKASCIANRRAYIGNLQIFYENGDKKIAQDKMVRSLPNKFDIFPISESVDVAINDGEEIVALVEFNDRILQFKERTLYVINASQDIEFLEDKLDYRGVTHKSSVIKTEYGIVWANKNGCFYYDGQKVNDLLQRQGRPLIKQDVWETFIGTPLVGYSPKKKQIIVVDDIGTGKDGNAYIYDMITTSWVKSVGVFPDTAKTNFVIDFNGDLIYSSHTGSDSLLKKWTDTATQTLPKIQIKDLDFGAPSQKKSVKKVYISYKGNGSGITVLYGKDGLTPASNFYKSGADGLSTNATDSDAPLHSSTVGTDDWVCAELKPVAGSIACNSFSILIDGTAGTDFEINDISIVYRPKSIK
tara:strand:- start:5862 stop:8501 length:2640 start_codon:yes stop_codon:yes gene_type:complete